MRINKFLALATGSSRRNADDLIKGGQVKINDSFAEIGSKVTLSDTVTLNGIVLKIPESFITIMLNKPVGYVCSRNGQGSKTIYDLIPNEYSKLNPIGRLDKDSSGLLLLTNNGDLAQQLSHPSQQKNKIYEIKLNKPLTRLDWSFIHEQGVELSDGPSKLFLEQLLPEDGTNWQVTMHEGRNRQIRRTFEALGYTVTKLHRIKFGGYLIKNLKSGQFQLISD
jgi:23S rRNA pseudouridine2605 synthase